MTSSLMIIAVVAGLGWYFSTKRGNPMRSNVNGAIYCLGATTVLLGFAIYSIADTASSNKEGGSAGYAVAVLTVPIAAAFAAGGWVFAKRAKSAKHQRPDDSPNSTGGADG